MTRTVRLDTELVRRGLAASRAEARRAIESGTVTVSGIPATRPAALVAPGAPIALAGPPARFVSRGGAKLDGALGRLGVHVEGKRWLDAGASTGGFTDCLLDRGAEEVIAVDVGYGQLDWRLRNDERVMVMERVNVRYLTPEDLPFKPQGVVADLSFISLTLVLPALVTCASEDADFVVLVKPQFEAGRAAVGRRGVVTDPATWRTAMEGVASTGRDLGLGLAGATASEIPGPAGNREFFLHLRRGASADADGDPIGRAVEEAP